MGLQHVKAFLDTFALLEMFQANRVYTVHLRQGVTGQLNLPEFHVHACRLRNEADADGAFRRLQSKVIPAEAADLLEASRVKRTVKGASYADALGYAMAQRHRIPFVTGDRTFRGLPGVVP